MPPRTITHLYGSHDDAMLAVRDLKSAGITEADISAVTTDSATSVTVQTDDAQRASIEAIMQRHNPVDPGAIRARRERIWNSLNEQTRTELKRDRVH